MVTRYLFLIVSVFIAACSGSQQDAPDSKEMETPSINTITVSRITFSVPDFERWFDIYMQEQPFREEAGLETMGIFIDSKTDGSYHIFLRATSTKSLNDYFDSKSYHNSFSIPASEIAAREIIDVTQLAEKTFDQNYRILISHRVKDYPEWKSIFDSDASNRELYDLETVGIGRGLEDPSLVYVMFAFDNEEKVKKYIDGNELREAMQDAGVIGSLKITQVEPIRGITY